MGHSDSKMLNEVYIHLDKHKLRENNVIENFVEEKIKTTTKIQNRNYSVISSFFEYFLMRLNASKYALIISLKKKQKKAKTLVKPSV